MRGLAKVRGGTKKRATHRKMLCRDVCECMQVVYQLHLPVRQTSQVSMVLIPDTPKVQSQHLHIQSRPLQYSEWDARWGLLCKTEGRDRASL